jgi:hypothetical protein
MRSAICWKVRACAEPGRRHAYFQVRISARLLDYRIQTLRHEYAALLLALKALRALK